MNYKGIMIIFWAKIIIGVAFIPLPIFTAMHEIYGIDFDNILLVLLSYIGGLVLIYGLLFLYKLNNCLKNALLLYPFYLLINIYNFINRYSAIILPTNDVIKNLIPNFVSIIIGFNILWGLALLAKKCNLLNLSRRIKLYYVLYLLYALLTAFVFAIIIDISIESYLTSSQIAILFSSFLVLSSLLINGYELYLLNFTHKQLISDNPRDIK